MGWFFICCKGASESLKNHEVGHGIQNAAVEGVNANALSNTSLLKILENYDEEVIKNNIKALKKYDISLNIIDGNPQVLTDKELDEKLNKLINIGKEARDISLSPKVLLKYDLKGLNNTINVLQISGLDPKKVPLIAY